MGESRMTGTVKWFSDQKGFGFNTPNNGGDDIFVHHSSIRYEDFRSLADGEEVEFVIESSEGRTKAVDVTGPNGDPVGGISRSRRGGAEGGGVYGGGSGYRGGERTGGCGGGSTEGCFKCGEMGHLARDCVQRWWWWRRQIWWRWRWRWLLWFGLLQLYFSGHFARDCLDDAR